MTNRNISRNGKKPFLLKPAIKEYLWGGTRLSELYQKGEPGIKIAESWECSTHPNGESVAAGGAFEGEKLSSILTRYPQMIGSHPHRGNNAGELPVLIKLIDASAPASIQVHPDDAYAREHENGARGKTEMWYVLDAVPDAKVVYGFHRDMERHQVVEGLKENTIEKYLQKVKASKDDVFMVETGCVHAIGSGILLAEIQQNSDVTYRMYDYHRKDSAGLERELHTDKALDVLNYKGSSAPKQPLRVLRYKEGCARELLCRCAYFQVERILLSGRKNVEYRTDALSFQILLCIRGAGAVRNAEDAEEISVVAGSCVFVPADSVELELSGEMELLQIRC